MPIKSKYKGKHCETLTSESAPIVFKKFFCHSDDKKVDWRLSNQTVKVISGKNKCPNCLNVFVNIKYLPSVTKEDNIGTTAAKSRHWNDSLYELEPG